MPEWAVYLAVFVGIPLVLGALKKIVKKTKPEWDDAIVEFLTDLWNGIKGPLKSKMEEEKSASKVQGKDKPSDG